MLLNSVRFLRKDITFLLDNLFCFLGNTIGNDENILEIIAIILI